jgi:hypothetical protein
MKTRAYTLLGFGYALALVGLFLPFWPFALFGVIVAALSGQWFAALLLGVLLDLIYGTPPGAWHFLHVPFTLLALLIVLLEHYSATYFISDAPDRL